MNKKILAVSALSAAMLLGGSALADGISVLVDGKAVEFDQPPVIENDRTLVPMRAIFEALGAEVEWDDATKSVTSKKGEKSVKLSINSDIMVTDAGEKKLDMPAKIINDRTMIPVRAVSEAMDCLVDWDGATQTVIITGSSATAAPEATATPEASAEPTSTPEATATPVPYASPVPASIIDGVNFFSAENLVPKKALDAVKNTESDNANTYLTDYIPVNENKSYFGGYFDPNALTFKGGICVNYAFYDADKKFISGANADMIRPVKAPEYASYLRFTIKLKPDGLRAVRYVCLMQTETAPTEFTKSAYFAKDAKTDYYADKKILLIGDNQVINGGEWVEGMEAELNPHILQTKTNGWYRFISDDSGSSLTGSKLINSLPAEADIVVVFSGQFDWQVNYSLGNDNLQSGGIYDFASMAKAKWKNAKIYFVTMPAYKYWTDGFTVGGLYNTRGMNSADYGESMKAAAQKYDLSVIDLSQLWSYDEIPVYLKESAMSYLYPNSEGAKLIADKINEALLNDAK